MNCPKCKVKAQWNAGRMMESGAYWRQYRCPRCGNLIETMERIIDIRRARKYERRKNT